MKNSHGGFRNSRYLLEASVVRIVIYWGLYWRPLFMEPTISLVII